MKIAIIGLLFIFGFQFSTKFYNERTGINFDSNLNIRSAFFQIENGESAGRKVLNEKIRLYTVDGHIVFFIDKKSNNISVY